MTNKKNKNLSTGVPGGESHPGVHGSVAVTADVQETGRRSEKRAERLEFQAAQHSAQTRAHHRDADMNETT